MWKHQVMESHPEPVQKKIFLVEDNLVVSRILQRTIEAYTSHRVIHLPNGATILEKIREYKPGLLILDYELPGKNGIELYDLVHATKGCEHIPAIIISAEPPQKLVAKRHLITLSKPYKTSVLLEMIEALMAEKENV